MNDGVFSKARTARLVGQAYTGQSRARPVPHVVVLLVGTGLFLLLQAAGAQGAGPPAQPNLLERVAALEGTVAQQAAEIAALTAALEAETASRAQADDALQGQVDPLEAKLAPFRVELYDPENPEGGYEVFLEGANLHIQNGLGATNGYPIDPASMYATQTNGLGNLIVGYNEAIGDRWDAIEEEWVEWSEADRAGSHNIILGINNGYPSFAGLVAGRGNYVGGPYASVSGGWHNTAVAWFASVSGGRFNTASAHCASVSGGYYNTASSNCAAVSGGGRNTANGEISAVSGGFNNTANGDTCSSVSGGAGNTASGNWASVSGGSWNRARGPYSAVGGGYDNTADGEYASAVSGGASNTASGEFSSSVSGGTDNTASGRLASVSGGSERSATGENDWRAGGLFEDD